MIISDLDHMEEVIQSSNIEGGRNIWQTLGINQVAIASIGNSNNNSIGNVAIAVNIAIPIMIAINLPYSIPVQKSSPKTSLFSDIF
ncbi:MAG: hypothetical protein HC903_02300 [Methylacidiphilales bacterium]|nr:hypothetical protein [Candidatus Methylacidiphilales bacterium]NJR16705.1 hypothetical protein [Calothrix sp. CSU_2_0]